MNALHEEARTPTPTADDRDAILRQDLESFIRKTFGSLHPSSRYMPNWHISAIAWHLEQVLNGKIKRLIITMPPRSLKSISASVAFPAFVHGHDPARGIICASYAQDLATKMQNDYRAILSSAWYRRLFPRTVIGPWKDAEGEILLTARGGRIATSVGGTLTGRGGDLIIVDDPIKPADALSQVKRAATNEWFGSTLLSRLNHKKTGAIVIVTQRVHADDLVGHLLERGGTDWTYLDLPAIAMSEIDVPVARGRLHRRLPDTVLHEAREPREVLDAIRREIGTEAFAAQYQQCPVPPGGNLFKRTWLKRYDIRPIVDNDDLILQSWDTASKTASHNDYSVCTTWHRKDGVHYLLDVRRARYEFTELKAAAIDLARAYGAQGVLVEEAGVGIGLIGELRKAGISAIGIRPTLEKAARAAIQTLKFESGRVLFPRYAPWLPDLEAELLAFPGGRHDDQVDSIVQALDYGRPPPVTLRVLTF